ncbi:MAG TPA: cytochrome b/b6 domain-containing protein [Acetobacteraceae bacterium]|jgi:thiosulfate reductase cytochrome b subunit|nr:cytochrome b/b6 domain-containing protein [Acetobacteraceae bacterium]
MHRIYLHPLPVRIWHWINAAAFIMLILTGLQLRYVGLIDVAPFRIAVTTHNLFGFVVIADFFLWLGYYLCSKRITAYHTELNPVKYFLGSMAQALYYGYGIFIRSPEPFHITIYRKFNPLQLMTYQVIMLVLIPIQCVTGLLLWDLERFSRVVALVGGVRVVDTVHVLIFIFFAFYLPAHIYLATLGRRPTTHIKEMLTGYEEAGEEERADAAE